MHGNANLFTLVLTPRMPVMSMTKTGRLAQLVLIEAPCGCYAHQDILQKYGASDQTQTHNNPSSPSQANYFFRNG
jgi:hypothetical protein